MTNATNEFQPTSPNTPEKRNFGQTAARLSWVCVLLAVGANYMTRANPASAMIGTLLSGVLVLLGAIAGLVALGTIPKFGFRRIAAPALIGLSMCGLILAAAIPAFNQARSTTRIPLSLTAEQLRDGGEYEFEVEGRSVDFVVPENTAVGTQLRLPGQGVEGRDLIFLLTLEQP